MPGGAALFVLLVLAAYLIGAIPFGYLIGRTRGVDLRKAGSGNIGATNAGRLLGRKWGLLILALDVLKGLVPAVLAGWMLVDSPPTTWMLLKWIVVGAAAVVGHVFPIYLNFRGGKGVATTIGVALGVFPYFTIAIAVALVGYGIVRYGTGLVSAGSIALAVVFPVAVFALTGLRGLALATYWPLHAVAVLLGLLIVVRHRSNIVRILRGEEMRAGRHEVTPEARSEGSAGQ